MILSNWVYNLNVADNIRIVLVNQLMNTKFQLNDLKIYIFIELNNDVIYHNMKNLINYTPMLFTYFTPHIQQGFVYFSLFIILV